MMLSLIDDTDLDITDITIKVPNDFALVIREQLDRINSDEERARFEDAFLRHLARVMGDFLDNDLRPPTERQVYFAFSLAETLEIELPREALIYRSVMNRFLSEHKEKSKANKRRASR